MNVRKISMRGHEVTHGGHQIRPKWPIMRFSWKNAYFCGQTGKQSSRNGLKLDPFHSLQLTMTKKIWQGVIGSCMGATDEVKMVKNGNFHVKIHYWHSAKSSRVTNVGHQMVHFSWKNAHFWGQTGKQSSRHRLKLDTASRFTHIDSIECTAPRPVWGCCLTSMEHRIPGHKLFPKQNFCLSYLTWSLWLVGRLLNMKNTYEFIEIERVELQSCACAHFEAFFM